MLNYDPNRPKGGENSTREGALGNTAINANPKRVNTGYLRKKYELQRVAAAVLSRDIFEWRTEGCLCRTTGSSVSVYASCGSAHYGGLQTCGSVWLCPVCAAKINMRRALEIEQIIEQSGYTPLLITWTIQHTLKSKLETVLSDLKAALAYTRSGAARRRLYEGLGVKGYIRAIETRWSPRNGYHPHAHEILLVDTPENEIDLELVKRTLAGRYHKKLRDLGYFVNDDYTVDVRVCYPSKEETRAQAAAKYLTKSAIHLELTAGQEKGDKKAKSFSPFQLLDMYQSTGDLYYADLFTEYAHATKGKRSLTFSKGLKKEYLIEEKTDEEIVKEQDEEAIRLCQIDRENWRKVIDKQLRAQILIEAALRAETLIEWLSSHDIHATIPAAYDYHEDSEDEMRRLVTEALQFSVIPA